MHSLWKKHRPMGLFYGCYAHPSFTIEPNLEISNALPRDFDCCNFTTEAGANGR